MQTVEMFCTDILNFDNYDIPTLHYEVSLSRVKLVEISPQYFVVIYK